MFFFTGRRGTDVAAQVGPGQTIDFLFSTGHGQDSWVFLISGDNEQGFQYSRDRFSIAEDYIANAPLGTNKAQHVSERQSWKVLQQKKLNHFLTFIFTTLFFQHLFLQFYFYNLIFTINRWTTNGGTWARTRMDAGVP